MNNVYPNKLTATAKNVVAVYGTLRTPAVQADGIVRGYIMVGLHSQFPVAIHTGVDTDIIKVNVLTVDNKQLARFDRYESEGHLYNRVVVNVEDNPKVLEPTYIRAYLYEGRKQFWQPTGDPNKPLRHYQSTIIKHGDWELYMKRRYANLSTKESAK